jgi:hypothetical protein
MPPKSKKESQVVISNATVIISNSTSNSKPKKEKRPSIPKKIRVLVWNTHIGELIGMAKCLCCNEKDISQMEFHCGHIISYYNGGADSVENMRPICASCNLSMGSENMNTFIERHQLTGNISNLAIGGGGSSSMSASTPGIKFIPKKSTLTVSKSMPSVSKSTCLPHDLESEWLAKKDRIVKYIENVKDKKEKMKYLLDILINDKSRLSIDINLNMAKPLYLGNKYLYNKIYIDYAFRWHQDPRTSTAHISNNTFSNFLSWIHDFLQGNCGLHINMLMDNVQYCTLNDMLEEFFDGFINCINADPTFAGASITTIPIAMVEIAPPQIKSENELFEEERVKLETEWNGRKHKVITYIENVKDKKEKFKHLLSTVVKDKGRIHFNITGRDLTNEGEMSNPCKSGNMHNKIYIDYGISMQQFSSSCGDCMLSNFISNVLTCVTRGHFQFKHGYHIRDPLLDSVNLYLANTPLNEKFEEFIDGFLNCMNIDPTF